MKAEDCIFFQLTRLSQAGVQFWAEQVAPLGLTPSQGMVLNFLFEEDGITSLALGRRLKITSATMTGLLDRLEKAGLIERRDHPQDRRSVLICLTKAGRKSAAEINRRFVTANEEFLQGLSPGEQSRLRALLRKLHP